MIFPALFFYVRRASPHIEFLQFYRLVSGACGAIYDKENDAFLILPHTQGEDNPDFYISVGSIRHALDIVQYVEKGWKVEDFLASYCEEMNLSG